MGHIDRNGGRFVTMLSAGRKEVTWFTEWVKTHAPSWTEAMRRSDRRIGDPDEIWATFEAPLPSEGGFRVIWVHSSAKHARDATSRRARIEVGEAALEATVPRTTREILLF
jgi:hypothetical protein